MLKCGSRRGPLQPPILPARSQPMQQKDDGGVLCRRQVQAVFRGGWAFARRAASPGSGPNLHLGDNQPVIGG